MKFAYCTDRADSDGRGKGKKKKPRVEKQGLGKGFYSFFLSLSLSPHTEKQGLWNKCMEVTTPKSKKIIALKQHISYLCNMNAICTIIIWGGMYYATPDWMDKQIPAWMWSRYEILIYPYSTPLTMDYDPKTTALIGFSAGGLDVLKNYKKDYAFVGLIDPSTREKFTTIEYGANTHMLYNHNNWGGSNKSMRPVAQQINKTGGDARYVNLPHKDIPKQFFNTYFHE